VFQGVCKINVCFALNITWFTNNNITDKCGLQTQQRSEFYNLAMMVFLLFLLILTVLIISPLVPALLYQRYAWLKKTGVSRGGGVPLCYGFVYIPKLDAMRGTASGDREESQLAT
jgi:hypothetical protein